MWTNSHTIVHNYGFSSGLTYRFMNFYTARANLSYSKLKKASNEDGLEDGFNTPEWITNFSLTNDQLYKNFGAGITVKWQSSYYWQSFLVNGQVDAYTVVDAQVTYRFSKLNTSIKAGTGNLLNHYYYSIAGGPHIGGFYYLTITYGLK